MIKLKDVLNEIPKGIWVNVDPTKYSDDLISIVQTAYNKTPEGSFINTKRDLVEPDWNSIDIDPDPDIDGTIFHRAPRSNEL